MLAVESRTIDLSGPLHYLEAGASASGPTFVLVHGLGGAHVNWLSLIPRLAERGRVLAPDLVGFGRTAPHGRSSRVEDNRVMLDRFLTETRAAPAVLIGNSMGGYISVMQAATKPETVAGLVLIDPALPRVRGAAFDRLVAAQFATFMVPVLGNRVVAARARRVGPEAMVRRTLELCTVDATRVDPAVVQASIALAQERAPLAWTTGAFLEAARSLVRALARPAKVRALVEAVTAPTLLIMGRQDRLVPIAAADSIARSRPDWEYVVFDDCGHTPQLERPVETLSVIERWLDGPAARAIGSHEERPASER